MFEKIKKLFRGDAPKTNPTLLDLQVGWVVEYDLKDWVVKKHYEYDWGNEFYSTEFLLDSGDDQLFLAVSDEDTEIECSISREIPLNSFSLEARKSITDNDVAPKEVEYLGKKYFLSETSQGYSNEKGSSARSEFVMYDYKDASEKEFVSITRWSESELEAFEGTYIPSYSFENIIPA